MVNTLLTDILEDGFGITKGIFDAKGDLLIASANNTPGILPVGADDEIPVADSAETLGIKWKPGVAGLDLTAIHVDAAGEIVLIDEKTDPVSDDHGLIEDSVIVGAEKAWYLCEENAANQNVADNSGNSNPGTASVNTSVLSQAGKVGLAFLLTKASTHRINIDTAVADTSSDTAGTVIAWYEPTNVATDFQYLWSFNDTNANTQIGLFINTADGKLRGRCIIAGVLKWAFNTDNVVLVNATYAQVEMSHNGVTPSMFIDGVTVPITFDVSIDKTIWLSGLTGYDNARIGDRFFNSGPEQSSFDGAVDDFRIYSRILIASERSDLNNGGSGTTDAIGPVSNAKKRVKLGNYLKAMTGQASAAFDWNSQNLDKINDIDIDGDLNHDGSLVGLYGTTPAAQSAAYTRNATIVEDRTLLASASATALNNNNVLAALIADLQSRGFIG